VSFRDRIGGLLGFGAKPKPANMHPLSRGLQQLFKGHAIESIVKDGWLTFANDFPPIQAEIVQEIPHQSGKMIVQLDVRVELPGGRVLVESFAGTGDELKTAANDAFNGFVQSSFHPIFRALYDQNDTHQEVESWTINGLPRIVSAGHAFIRGSIPDGQSAVKCIAMADDLLKDSDLPGGVHWLRVFYAQSKGEPMEIEVLLNNEPWDAFRAKLTQLPWPKVAPFYSVRRFMIIMDDGISSVATLP